MHQTLDVHGLGGAIPKLFLQETFELRIQLLQPLLVLIQLWCEHRERVRDAAALKCRLTILGVVAADVRETRVELLGHEGRERRL